LISHVNSQITPLSLWFSTALNTFSKQRYHYDALKAQYDVIIQPNSNNQRIFNTEIDKHTLDKSIRASESLSQSAILKSTNSGPIIDNFDHVIDHNIPEQLLPGYGNQSTSTKLFSTQGHTMVPASIPRLPCLRQDNKVLTQAQKGSVGHNSVVENGVEGNFQEQSLKSLSTNNPQFTPNRFISQEKRAIILNKNLLPPRQGQLSLLLHTRGKGTVGRGKHNGTIQSEQVITLPKNSVDNNIENPPILVPNDENNEKFDQNDIMDDFSCKEPIESSLGVQNGSESGILPNDMEFIDESSASEATIQIDPKIDSQIATKPLELSLHPPSFIH
jgi:hypothetical protein